MKTFVLAAALAVAPLAPALAEGETHYLAIHVDQNDPQVMNMALNNAQNVASHYAAEGDTVMIEMVAYGPGLNMYVAGDGKPHLRGLWQYPSRDERQGRRRGRAA